MATQGIVADGTTVVFGGASLGEIMSLSGTRSRRIKEVLSTGSADGAVERLAGALDEGTISIHTVYDGSAAGAYNSINTKFQTDPPVAETLLITFKDTSSISVSALLADLSVPSFNAGDDVLECDMTLALSGKATYTDVA